MKNNIIWLSFIAFLTLTMFSCVNGSSGIGVDLNPYQESPMVYVDTITVKSYTVKLDSSVASSSGSLFAGNINLPNFGKINSDAYFQFAPSSKNLLNVSGNESIVYDSLVLVLKYSYAQGDTTIAQQLHLNQLKEIPSSINLAYSNTKLAVETTDMASKIYKAKPKRDTAVNLKINDSFGKALFQKITTQASMTQTEMNKIIKGCKLSSIDNASAALLQFNLSSSYLRLYSHTDRTLTKFTATFGILPSISQFNSFDYNSIFANLNSKKANRSQIASELTNNNTFVYSGVGLATKVTFPYLNQLRFVDKFKGIIKAQLQVHAIMKSKSDYILPTSSLGMSVISSKNEVLGVLASSGSPVTGSFALNPDQVIMDGYYTFDITGYLNGILNGSNPNNGLLLTLPANATTQLLGVTLGDKNNVNHKTTLKLYYSQGTGN